MQAVKVEGFLLFKKLHRNVAVRLNTRHWQILFHTEFFVIPENAVVSEGKATAVNMTKERVVILVELCIALCGHTGMTHHDVYAVRNVNLHFPSGKGALINPQTVVKVIGDACRVCAAHLTFSCESVQDFVLRMGAQALLKIN